MELNGDKTKILDSYKLREGNQIVFRSLIVQTYADVQHKSENIKLQILLLKCKLKFTVSTKKTKFEFYLLN